MTGFSEEWLQQHQAKMARVSQAPSNVVQLRPAEKPVKPPRAKARRLEQELQKAVIEFLDVALPPDWRVIHVPNGGARSGAEAGILKAMGVRAGVPDLVFFGPRARVVVAEAKAGRGALSDAQEEWRDWFLANGTPWFTFRSIDELIAGCTDAGIPLRVRG